MRLGGNCVHHSGLNQLAYKGYYTLRRLSRGLRGEFLEVNYVNRFFPVA